MIPKIPSILKQHGERDTMQTDKKKKIAASGTRRLSHVIMEYLMFSAIISVFTFLFLYTTASSIGENYLMKRGVSITEIQDMVFHVWLRSICIFATIIIFVVLFLFMLAQRLSYLMTIISGVEKLQQNKMDHFIRPEGNDDLTLLAESINFLSAEQRDLNRREQQLKEEREAMIRSLSHDIRTPLTSMLAFSEFMMNKDNVASDEMKSYIDLVYKKSQQIKHLTAQLIEPGREVFQKIDSVLFLMEQLSAEWEAVLEERFSCKTSFSKSEDFSGEADVFSLRRIIDNLVSNTEKYADPAQPVFLDIRIEDGTVSVMQKNNKKQGGAPSAESHLVGLDNIRKIASLYDGSVSIEEDSQTFAITVFLHMKFDL